MAGTAMSLISKLRERQAEPEPTPVEPSPPPTGCVKCAPQPFSKGPKFGGTILARGRAVPTDNGLRVL
ncbi:hypothetical protein [Mycobacteroides chelonae]|uniref:hypothetical protein n=1 Tax=Mycobacteroides chelonae TaxID=1774 RepID=UPI0038773385